MKNLKARVRPTPDEALAIAAQTAPSQPPAQIEMSDRSTTLNLRLRETTINAITATARTRGLTIKQLVAHALAETGVAIAPADLEDRTPRRGQGASRAHRYVTPPSNNVVTP
jgi:hypothetical protein